LVADSISRQEIVDVVRAVGPPTPHLGVNNGVGVVARSARMIRTAESCLLRPSSGARAAKPSRIVASACGRSTMPKIAVFSAS
jgi:hypothetical protein